MTTRDDLAPLDGRPEDVDTSFFRLVPRQHQAAPSSFINQALRRAAGRGLAIPPTAPQQTAPSLVEASALIDAGDVRSGIALALASDEPDEEAIHLAQRALIGDLEATVLKRGVGYEPVAAILSVSPDPGLTVRDSAALALLGIDGPGDAHTAGLLMTATGDDLTAIVNGLRLRAGLPALTWETDETPLAFDDVA